MIIHPAGSRPSANANADYFTGTVRMDPLITSPAPARLNAVSVTFEPGARTAWHTHPLGQTLIVCHAGDHLRRMGQRPGRDIGAAPDCAMTHIALQEMQDGSAADWSDQVTDAEYGA